MSFRFSQKLIDETIACFKAEDGIVLPEEAVNEYLESFAKLYLAFAREKLVRHFAVGASAPRRNDDSSPDLISPHSCKERYPHADHL